MTDVPARATLEDDDEPEKMVEEVKEEKEVLEEEEEEEVVVVEEQEKEDTFDQVPDLSLVEEVDEEVMEAYAKCPRAQLTVTKETILVAIDRGNADYLRAHFRTTKKTVNTLFVNTRDSFLMAAKNTAGKKHLVSATVLTSAIYPFAADPTREATTAYYAIVRVLLTQCFVMVSGEKDGFLLFIAVDAWQMARETPEARDDPSPHSPLKRRMLLAKLLLEADPTWLIEPAHIIEALQAVIVYIKSEFYGPGHCSPTRSAWPC